MPLLIKDNVGEIVEDITLDMLENREAFERKGYMYETGWQACNLTEINMLENQTKEQFFHRTYMLVQNYKKNWKGFRMA